MLNTLIHKLETSKLNPSLQWEMCTLEIQSWCQQKTMFRRKQHDFELKSLRASLRTVNRHIYMGENHEVDRCCLQCTIEQREQTIWEQDKSDVVPWIEREGKCHPNYLHLEDVRTRSCGIDSIKDTNRKILSGEATLEVLREFYAELYSLWGMR